ncbi:uncharacterized protein LOC106865671 [Brachypodium distachyon]|uniref:uncharacterized protein LOC106865671 n=1 Tax=Brachypodium distachyon TaxID=15368 RepID=UPI00071D268E|nr:uncharacterized protein LOC106865671 [Brachypodium distachyon]|eukprot:XP_014751745.1 uncharacterized protein LOC106865671 [Brachypodium distachyon]
MASREATVARGAQISRPSHSLSLFLQPWRGATALKPSCRWIRRWCPDLSVYEGRVLQKLFPRHPPEQGGRAEAGVPLEGADWDLPRESYVLDLLEDEDGSGSGLCLVMNSAGDSDLTIIGNFQQQNMHVAYDLEKNKLVFVPARCDKM